jgi:hypothetical protein
MTGKLTAGVLVAACFGAVMAAGHGDVRQPASDLVTRTILVGGCAALGGPGGTFVVPLGSTNELCVQSGAPLHGVPIPSHGNIRNLRVTGGYGANAESGSVVTVYVNGSPTALSCTVGTAGTCENQTDSIKVKAGDEVSATFTAPDASDQMIMSFEKR